MCPGNETIKCDLGMGLANLPWEWDNQKCLGNGTNQCAQRMGLSNVPWE